MKKIITLIILSLVLVSCGHKTKEVKQIQETGNNEITTPTKDSNTENNDIENKEQEKDITNLNQENKTEWTSDITDATNKSIEVLKPEVRNMIETWIELQNQEVKTEKEIKQIEEVKEKIDEEIISTTKNLDLAKEKWDETEIKKLQKEVRALKLSSRIFWEGPMWLQWWAPWLGGWGRR